MTPLAARETVGTDASSEPRASFELAIVERELWGEGGLDAARIRELAGRVSATPIAKVVAPSGSLSGQPQHGGEGRWRLLGLQPVDGHPGYLAGPRFHGQRWRREVVPLDQVLDEPVVPDARPSVLVLVPAPEGDDAEVELHDLTAKLAAQFRFVVVALAEHGAASNTTVAEIWGDAGPWFDLAALPRELHGSCLAVLLRRYQVETLLVLDGTLWLGGSMAWVRARFPRLRFVSWLSREPGLMTHWRLQDLVTGLDRWLVSGEPLARRILRLPELQTARLRYLRRGVEVDPNGRRAPGGARALELRAALGVPDGAMVVAMSATRAAENRHEDFVGLANLSREMAGVHFLLAGDVGSTGGVERLAAAFRLTNFTHVPAGFPQDDLLAVTDVACSTGEEGASLTFLLKALAAGTPILATAAAAEEIMARDAGCGAFVVRDGRSAGLPRRPPAASGAIGQGAARGEGAPGRGGVLRARPTGQDAGRGARPRRRGVGVSLSTCVVIPSYNHERFIGEAVESVLSQSTRPDQIVVIDDGSTDNTREVLRRFSPADVVVRTEENCGAHAAITRGIDETSADLIFILDSDDRFHPERVRRFVELFESERNLALAGSWLDVIDEKGRTLDLKKAWKNLEPWAVADRSLTFLATEDARGNLLQANYLASTSNFVFRRDTWERHRPFRPLRYAHDWDFALRVACREAIAVLPEPLVAYRVHRRNTIRENQLAMEFEVMWVMAAHLREFLTYSKAVGSGGARQDLLRRTLHSVQTFGRDRLFWLMVALANGGTVGAEEFHALLDPANPTRRWLAQEMR